MTILIQNFTILLNNNFFSKIFMNPMEKENDSEDVFNINSMLLSNKDIIPIIPSFDAKLVPQNLFSRNNKPAETMENSLSFSKLRKQSKNIQPLKVLVEEKFMISNYSKSFYVLAKVLFLCKIFIQKLKNNRTKQIKWKKNFPIEILHDKTIFNQTLIIEKNVFRIIYESMKYYLNWKRIINFSKNSQINIFDIFFIFIIPLILIDAPLNLARLQSLTFMHFFQENVSIFLKTLLFFIFSINLLSEIIKKKFMKKKYFEEYPIENSKNILQYMFSLDFLANLSLVLYFFNEANISLFPQSAFFIEFRILSNFLIYFSTKIISDKAKKLKYCLQFSLKTQEKLDFFQLCFITLYILHNFSCIYLYLAIKELEKGEIWSLNPMNYLGNSNQDFYLYISAILHIIKGNGLLKTSPDSPLFEKIFFLAMYTIVCSLLIVNLGNIYRVIKKINEKNEEDDHHMLVLSQGSVKYSTALLVHDILQREANEKKINELLLMEKPLNNMPFYLKFNVLNEKFGMIMKNLPFLQLFSLSFKKKFLMCLEEKRFSPKQVLIKLKEEPFFILVDYGVVNVSILTSLNEEKVVKKYNKNDFYGEIFLFSDKLPLLSVISQNYTIVMIMKKDNFLKIVKENSSDYEKYCYLRDKVFFYTNTQKLSNQCELCEKKYQYCCCIRRLYWYFSFKQIFFLKKSKFPKEDKEKIFNGRKKNKSKNSLNNKSIMLEILLKHKIVPHVPSTFIENKSNTITTENNSEELSDTSLGRFLQKKSTNFISLKEKSNEFIENISNYPNNENDSPVHKKPALILENISEESDVPETFTMNIMENGNFSSSFGMGINLTPSFDKVSEFEYYFKHNNISNVAFPRRNEEKKRKNVKNVKTNGLLKKSLK